MKTVLLIDDLRVFRVTDPYSDLAIARTSAEALEILKAEPEKEWDEIWFDHDLGFTPDGEPDTTLPVADYLAERSFFLDPVKVGIVFIHTSNPVGARTLTVTLNRYGYHTRQVHAESILTIDQSLY